jgi:hypothetical protein
MKLFITNKKYFESIFCNNQTTKKVHINAFNELKQSIDVSNSIPLMLTPNYDDEGICLFDFINKKDDIYFYEFINTAK